MTDLGTLGGANSHALAVNERREVVGLSDTASGEQHAFVWRDGVMTDLGALAGPGASAAVDINDRGQVVGFLESDNILQPRSILWTLRR
jgi:probable HAF family extracellular repeat protein